MARKYQRHRDRFRVNLTKASGLQEGPSPAESKFPRRCEVEACCLEISQIASGQSTTVHLGDRCNHAVRCRHSTSLANGSAHDFPIGQRRFLGQTEDAIGKSTTPVRKSLFQPIGALIRPYLMYAKGNLGDRHRWQGELGVISNQPRKNRLVGSLLQGFGHNIGVEENQSSMP